MFKGKHSKKEKNPDPGHGLKGDLPSVFSIPWLGSGLPSVFSGGCLQRKVGFFAFFSCRGREFGARFCVSERGGRNLEGIGISCPDSLVVCLVGQ